MSRCGYLSAVGFAAVVIMLSAVPTAQAVEFVASASRQVHNGVPFDLPIPPGGVLVEPRQAGSPPAIVLTFDMPPVADDGSLDCSEITLTHGSCGAVTIAGNEFFVSLTDLTPNTCLTLAVQGITDLAGEAEVSVLLHTGNVNADANVNVLDLQAVKNQLFRPVDAATYHYDINCDGTLNVLDLQASNRPRP